MNHLGSRIGLLIVVGNCNTIELGLTVVSREDATGILPGDGTSCFDLRPGESTVCTSQMPSFCHEIEDASLAFAIAWIPVLHSTILDFCSFLHNYLDDSGMKLVLVSHRCRTTFKVADVGIIVANDESSLELSCATSIYAEISAEFHRTTNAFRNIDERAVAEDCRVECGKEVVFIRYYAAQVFAYQIWMLANGLANGAEDDSFLAQLFLESSLHTNRVHHGIDGCSGQCHSLFQRNSKLVESLHEFRVNLSGVCRRSRFSRLCRCRIIGDVLIVDRRHLEVSPGWLL